MLSLCIHCCELIIMCAHHFQSLECIKHQAHYIQTCRSKIWHDDGMRSDLELMLNEVKNDKSDLKRKKLWYVFIGGLEMDHLFPYLFIRWHYKWWSFRTETEN